MGEEVKKRCRLRPGPSSVFVARSGERTHAPTSFKLDVHEDGAFFSRWARGGFAHRRRRLMHYISAGGMGQMRRTTADDIQEMRQRRFLAVLVVLAALWVLFLFVPLP